MTITTMNDTQAKKLKLGYILIMLSFMQWFNSTSSAYGEFNLVKDNVVSLILAVALILGLYFIFSAQDVKGYKLLLTAFALLTIIPLIMFIFFFDKELGFLRFKYRFINEAIIYSRNVQVLVFIGLLYKGMLKDKSKLYNWIPVGLYSAIILERIYYGIVHGRLVFFFSTYTSSIIMVFVCALNILSLRKDYNKGHLYCSSCGHLHPISEQKHTSRFVTKIKLLYGKLESVVEKIKSYYTLKVWIGSTFSLLVVHLGLQLIFRLMIDYIDFSIYNLLG